MRDARPKWKYYALSRKGRHLLEPQQAVAASVFVVLSPIILAIIGLGLMAAGLLSRTGFYSSQMVSSAAPALENTAAGAPSKAAESLVTAAPVSPVAAVLVFLGVLVFAYAVSGLLKEWRFGHRRT